MNQVTQDMPSFTCEHLDSGDYCGLMVELQAQNDKLRELAQNLRRVIPADVVGVVIGANTDHPSYYEFDKAFRELRVEEPSWKQSSGSV